MQLTQTNCSYYIAKKCDGYTSIRTVQEIYLYTNACSLFLYDKSVARPGTNMPLAKVSDLDIKNGLATLFRSLWRSV